MHYLMFTLLAIVVDSPENTLYCTNEKKASIRHNCTLWDATQVHRMAALFVK